MKKEYLEVVNDRDEIVSLKERAEIHRLNLPHRAVHILIFNAAGELFLQKRSLAKDRNPGLWDSSAAGHVDIGESYAACARRELAEELGVAAELAFLFKLEARPELGMEFMEIYRGTHNGPFQLAADEIDEGRWFYLSEVDHLTADSQAPLTLTFKTIWRHYRAGGGDSIQQP